MKDFPKVPTWQLERDTNPRPSEERRRIYQCATMPHKTHFFCNNSFLILLSHCSILWPSLKHISSYILHTCMSHHTSSNVYQIISIHTVLFHIPCKTTLCHLFHRSSLHESIQS